MAEDILKRTQVENDIYKISIKIKKKIDKSKIVINFENYILKNCLNCYESVEEDIIDIISSNIGEILIDYFNYFFLRCEASKNWNYMIKSMESSSIELEKFISIYRNLISDIDCDISNYINSYTEVINSYFRDEEIIKEKFNVEGGLKKVKVAAGDIHGGKSVCILIFDKGKLIYKPYKCLNQILLEQIIDTVCKTSNNKFKYIFPFVLNRDKYSWVEFIRQDKKIKERELRDFYYECGSYLAVFYLLNSSDMHYENMIVHKGHPVFIDTETLCSNIGCSNNNSDMKNFQSSVLPIGMLPIPKNNIMDLSFCILFNKNVKIKSKVINQSEVTFDEMRGFVYTETPWIQETNKIKIDENTDSINSFVEGFRKSLKEIIKNKSTIINILESYFETYNPIFRKVIKNTNVYVEFLEAIRNPNIQKKNKTEEILKLLRADSDINIWKDEIESLKRGCIPSYYVDYKGENLYNAYGIKVTKFKNGISALKGVLDKMGKLDQTSIDYQVGLIKMSYLVTHDDVLKNNMHLRKEVVYSKEIIVNFINSIIYIDEQKENYYGIIVDSIYGTNYGDIYPGLLNTAGWVLTLCYFRGENNDYFKHAKKLFFTLIEKANFKEDNSLFTGSLGVEFVRRVVFILTKDDLFKKRIHVDTKKLNEKDLHIYKLITNNNLLKAVDIVKNMFEFVNITSNRQNICSNSPYFTGILPLVLKGLNRNAK